ncbi:hypothetical protein BX666DRAFT_1262296 [Dichotomocladium elegans]|nr:hypothetical protein BX666DRAFT_1262296 [Dichotomocladium elegans]
MSPFFPTLVLLFCLTAIAAFVEASPAPGSGIPNLPALPTHFQLSLAESLKPEPTAPAYWRHAERDGPDDGEKDSQTIDRTTKADSKGKSVFANVTTVVVIPSDGNKYTSNVYPNDNDHGNQQDVSSGGSGNNSNNSASDPSNDNNVTEQLKQDQAALRRMITILSVVGGVGAIAVVVSVLVFTRMRTNKRKRFEAEEEALRVNGSSNNGSCNGNSNHNNNDVASIDTTSTTRGGLLVTATAEATPPLARTTPSPADMDHSMPIPSAPPAPEPFLASLDQSTYERRRNIISTISQATPAPSAPTAKELDGMIELPSSQTTGSSSSAMATTGSSSLISNQHPSPSEQNKRYPQYEQGQHYPHTPHALSASPVEPPEGPPPAYTPSAPPFYALPPEPVFLFRRHSQG